MSNNNNKPQAYLSVNKNRRKHYDNVELEHNSFSNVVYLKDRAEFEIELDNPTKHTYLAKISIDGNQISNSGIVLRPGEHIYLDRYIDKAKRFRFDTYQVPKRNSNAIGNNGVITVRFFKERTVGYYKYPTPDTWIGTTPHDEPRIYYHSDYGSHSGDYTDMTWTTTTSGDDTIGHVSSVSHSNAKLSADEPSIETGKVEEGSDSQQRFHNVNKDFSSFASETVNIKILPESNKALTKQDIRVYCVNCGRKFKKNWNFCPSCGTEKQ